MLIAANVCSEEMKVLIGFIKTILLIAQIIIPILLIIWGTIDLGKAVIASKEEDIKKAQGMLVKRIIYAILVFLLVVIVNFAMGIVGNNEWKSCWKGAITCENGINPITGECNK